MADIYDEAEGRYKGLRCGKTILLSEEDRKGLLVKPDIAAEQLEKTPTGNGHDAPTPGDPGPIDIDVVEEGPEKDAAPKRFHGSVLLNENRVGRDAGQEKYDAEQILSDAG